MFFVSPNRPKGGGGVTPKVPPPFCPGIWGVGAFFLFPGLLCFVLPSCCSLLFLFFFVVLFVVPGFLSWAPFLSWNLGGWGLLFFFVSWATMFCFPFLLFSSSSCYSLLFFLLLWAKMLGTMRNMHTGAPLVSTSATEENRSLELADCLTDDHLSSRLEELP